MIAPEPRKHAVLAVVRRGHIPKPPTRAVAAVGRKKLLTNARTCDVRGARCKCSCHCRASGFCSPAEPGGAPPPLPRHLLCGRKSR